MLDWDLRHAALIARLDQLEAEHRDLHLERLGPAAGIWSDPDETDPLTAEEVSIVWEDAVTHLRNNRTLQALCRGVEWVQVRHGVIVLGFKYDFHRVKVADPANTAALAQALSEELGRPVSIICERAEQEADCE